MKFSKVTMRAFLIGVLVGEAAILGFLWYRGGAIFGERQGQGVAAVQAVPTQVLSGAYPLNINKINAPADPGSGGAIDGFGRLVVMSTRRGEFSVYAKDQGTGFARIDVPNPVDVETQEKAASPFRIGLQDLQVVPGDVSGQVRMYVSVTEAQAPDGNCVYMRAAYIDVAEAVLTDSAPSGDAEWSYIFDSNRCIASDSGFNHEAGGAIGVTGDGQVLMTIGPFGFDGTNGIGDVIEPQDPDSHLGKVVRIDPETKTSEIYSIGHRNADGLFVTPDDTVWQLEHGPRGGDEINIIEPGVNYGWPIESYGTGYGSFGLATSESAGLHDNYRLPIYSFVPSLGASALDYMTGSEYPLWEGDLLVSSLKGSRIDRLHLREGRVVVAEPIPIGVRIRDIAVDGDGVIYLKSDNEPLVYQVVNGNADGESEIAGLSFCASCHQIDPNGSPNASGPSLVGVFGRDIASDSQFVYSEALSSVSGTWDAQSLRQYIANPEAFAPGTLMPQLDLKDWEVGQAVQQLEGL